MGPTWKSFMERLMHPNFFQILKRCSLVEKNKLQKCKKKIQEHQPWRVFSYGAHGSRRVESSIRFPPEQKMCTSENEELTFKEDFRKIEKRNHLLKFLSWRRRSHHGLQCSRKSQSRSQFQAILNMKSGCLFSLALFRVFFSLAIFSLFFSLVIIRVLFSLAILSHFISGIRFVKIHPNLKCCWIWSDRVSKI